MPTNPPIRRAASAPALLSTILKTCDVCGSDPHPGQYMQNGCCAECLVEIRENVY